MSPKAMKVMKKPSAMKAKKNDDEGLVLKLELINGNSGEVVQENGRVLKSDTPDALFEAMLDEHWDWEDGEEYIMDVAKQCCTFTLNGASINKDHTFQRLLCKEGDHLKMDVGKFEINAVAVLDTEDTMAEAPAPARIQTDGQHSMPPPIGTFLK